MLIQRIVTGAILIAVVVGSILFLPALWAGLVLGTLWLLGVREWTGFARLGTGASMGYILVFAGLMWAAVTYGDRPAVVPATLIVSSIWWAVAFCMVVIYPRPISVPVVMAAGFLTLLPAWLLFAHLHAAEPLGRYLLLGMLVIVWSADIGAFLVGRAVGRIKLAPSVSPGKTWEGVIGGVACAAIAGLVLSLAFESEPSVWIAIAVAAAVSSVVGDLTVSMFKRNVGLKDSGALLPGHGGVLDRVDSLTSAVVVYLFGLMITGALS